MVFLDEIDVVRSLPFSTDEFFAAIRACHNRQASQPDSGLLTFCLLGVAAPSELIRDTRHTPFNVGRRIELEDFTEAEALPLAEGLVRREGQVTGMLRRILYWTGGHPYLTQRLCRAIAADFGFRNGECGLAIPKSQIRNPKSVVDRLCGDLFLSPRARQRDDNLLSVQERILRSEVDHRPAEEVLAGLLDLYSRIRARRRVAPDDTNLLLELLCRSGIVRLSHARMVVRNRIYERVFDRAWVAANMPDAEVRRQAAAFRRGLLRASAVAAAVVMAVGGLAAMALRSQSQLRHALRDAERERSNTAREARRAVDSEGRERSGRQHAEAAQAQAVRARGEADRERARADLLRGLAERRGEEARRRLIHLDVATGEQMAEQGDLPGALLWFVEALKLEQPGGAGEAVQRTRIASVLRQTPRLLQVWRPEAPIMSAAFSPDGARVVTLDDRNAARVLDAKTGQVLSPPLRHQGGIGRANFSPDGRRLVTASDDSTARIWDFTPGASTCLTLRHGHGVISASFSPDGRLVLTNSADRTARLWNAATGAPAGAPLRHARDGGDACFSPDGSQFLTVSMDEVRIWSTTTASELRALSRAPGPVLRVVWTPDGKRIIAIGNEYVSIWEAATGKLAVTSAAAVRPIAAWSPDGRWVTTAQHGTAPVRTWDLWNANHAGPVLNFRQSVLATQFTPHSGGVRTFDADGTLREWDPDTGEQVASPLRFGGANRAAIFAEDGRLLLTMGRDGLLRLWDTVSRRTPDRYLRPAPSAIAAAFSPDGRRFGALGTDGKVRVLDVDSGTVTTSVGVPVSPAAIFPGHLALAPDGPRMWADSLGGVGHLWDSATGGRVLPLKHNWVPSSAFFSRDGRRLLTGGLNRVCIWDLKDGSARPRELVGHTMGNPFSPDGGRIVLQDGNIPMISLWDLSRAAPLRVWSRLPPDYRRVFVLPNPEARHRFADVYQFSFSPDRRLLLSAGTDDAARIWDAATGRPSGPVLRHGGAVTCARFSPDGRRIVTGSTDQTAMVWDAATRKALVAPMRHEGPVVGAEFSPDGGRLVTHTAKAVVRLWDALTGEALTLPLHFDHPVTAVRFSAGGKRILVTLSSGEGHVWEPAPDLRPVSDLARLAELLASRRIAPNGASAPMESGAIVASWRAHRPRYPVDPTPQPDLGWHRFEARRCEEARLWADAAAHLGHLIQAYPAEHRVYRRRIDAYAELDRWQEVAADLDRMIRLGGGDHVTHHRAALVRLGAGDAAGYRRACTEMLSRFAGSGTRRERDITAWTCALGPQSEANLAAALALDRELLRTDPPNRSYLGTLAALLYRKGEYAAALQRQQEATGSPENEVGDHLFRAMILIRLGRRPEARQSLADARSVIEQKRISATAGEWDDRLERQLFLREAESLLRGDHAATP